MNIHLLKGRQDHLIQERIRLSSLKHSYMGKLNLKDEVDALLEKLAEHAQADAISLYSELLSKLVTDVMGKKQEVVLETSKKRDKVHLDMYIVEDGKHIDILDGKGGSVCNIISVGMRIVALLQSPNRRFLFLDEPDCWIEPALVGRFVAILKRLCKDVGLQVVYISHHSEDIFGNDVRNIHLSDKRNIRTDIKYGEEVNDTFLPDKVKEDNDNFGIDWLEGQGIKEIQLQIFMSHQSTVIPLSDDMTLITGENDVGKSVVFRAFKALVDNNPKRSYIRHGEEFALVSLVLENDVKISWSFSSKKSIKPVYTIYHQQQESIFEVKPGEVPSDVSDYLNFGIVGDFDLHLADQKDPLFILNSNVKGSDRAQFLALSDDFDTVLKMIDEHKRQTNEARSEVRLINGHLDIVNEKIKVLKPLPVVESLSHNANELPAVDTSDLSKVINYIGHGKKFSDIDVQIRLLNDIDTASFTPKAPIVSNLLSQLRAKECDDVEVLRRLQFSMSTCATNSAMIKRCIESLDIDQSSEALSLMGKLLSNTVSESPVLSELSQVVSVLANQHLSICEKCGQEITRH